MMLKVGEHLVGIAKIDDDILMVSTAEEWHIFKAVGDWGHPAWVESINNGEFVKQGEILEIRDDGWHFMIRTANGYNDIELRVEWGYEGEFRELPYQVAYNR